jgi:phytanoyl-CoA hydroxylase
MQTDSHQSLFDRDGFVVIRGLLPPDELAQLRQNLDRYIRAVVPDLPGSDAFYEHRDRPETL